MHTPTQTRGRTPQALPRIRLMKDPQSVPGNRDIKTLMYTMDASLRAAGGVVVPVYLHI